jgi:hypothetical protein
MKNYSIVRVGNEYIVQADEKSVLKIASRRMAAKLVTDAAELLEQQPAPQVSGDRSISRDLGAISDPDIISDRELAPDPSEVP